MQTKTKAAIQLLALVGIAVVVVTLRWSWPEQNEFRGKLRYPVLHIGGEGSDAILDTGTKAFDLLFKAEPIGGPGWKNWLISGSWLSVAPESCMGLNDCDTTQ